MADSSTDLNTAESQNFDAKQLTEEIQTGEQKAPKVNVEADYEASKEYSVSDIDRSGEGAKAANEATAPEHKMPEAKATETHAESTGDPAEFKNMAHDLRPDAASNRDDLVQKAFQKGQPGQ